MKYFAKERKKYIIFGQYVGYTKDDDGLEIELNMSAAYCPIVTLPSGESVLIEWDDLIKLAMQTCKEVNK